MRQFRMIKNVAFYLDKNYIWQTIYLCESHPTHETARVLQDIFMLSRILYNKNNSMTVCRHPLNRLAADAAWAF